MERNILAEWWGGLQALPGRLARAVRERISCYDDTSENWDSDTESSYSSGYEASMFQEVFLGDLQALLSEAFGAPLEAFEGLIYPEGDGGILGHVAKQYRDMRYCAAMASRALGGSPEGEPGAHMAFLTMMALVAHFEMAPPRTRAFYVALEVGKEGSDKFVAALPTSASTTE